MQALFKEAQRLTSPNPFCLVTSLKEDGQTNLMALSWWTYVSNNPPTVAVCLSQKSYSVDLIRENGEFGLCIVDGSLKESAFKCGTRSGRGLDKAQAFGIELFDAVEIKPRLVKAYKIALECGVIKTVPVQDHVMCVGEVKKVHLNPGASQLFSFEGYRLLDTLEY
jgi:flavin reductase (DIM6/NTAB) family NADH-FMN oxidoreductase RutF